MITFPFLQIILFIGVLGVSHFDAIKPLDLLKNMSHANRSWLEEEKG